jgi:hypothetical protein
MPRIPPAKPAEGEEETQIHVGSIFGYHTRQGLVELQVGDQPRVQMEPVKARLVAQWLIEAAEAAEQEDFLVSFVMKLSGMPLEQAALILREFRQHRDREKSTSA